MRETFAGGAPRRAGSPFLFGAFLLAGLLLAGCDTVPSDKTRSLRLDVALSDDHEEIIIHNIGALSLERIEVNIYTQDKRRFIFKFPEDIVLPPDKKARSLMSNFKEEKTGAAFSDWSQIYRIVVHTPTEYWSGGGTSR